MHDVHLGTHHLGSTVTLFPWLHKAIPTLWRVQQLREAETDTYEHIYISGRQMDEMKCVINIGDCWLEVQRYYALLKGRKLKVL